MRVIYKYEAPLIDSVIELPMGAEILSIQLQRGVPHFWAFVDPEAPKIDFNVRILGTGRRTEADYLNYFYVGTILTSGDNTVLHYFMGPKEYPSLMLEPDNA